MLNHIYEASFSFSLEILQSYEYFLYFFRPIDFFVGYPENRKLSTLPELFPPSTSTQLITHTRSHLLITTDDDSTPLLPAHFLAPAALPPVAVVGGYRGGPTRGGNPRGPRARRRSTARKRPSEGWRPARRAIGRRVAGGGARGRRRFVRTSLRHFAAGPAKAGDARPFRSLPGVCARRWWPAISAEIAQGEMDGMSSSKTSRRFFFSAIDILNHRLWSLVERFEDFASWKILFL